METSLAEELPALYRAVLDRVAVLETAGARADAVRIRDRAIRIYSRAWDEPARRDLAALLREASVPAAPSDQGAGAAAIARGRATAS